jgi:hypothetical protein
VGGRAREGDGVVVMGKASRDNERGGSSKPSARRGEARRYRVKLMMGECEAKLPIAEVEPVEPPPQASCRRGAVLIKRLAADAGQWQR